MSSGKPLLVDVRSNSETLRLTETDEPFEVCKELNDSAQSVFKLNTTASTSFRELLECPVCLNSMFPPIHQVFLWHSLLSGLNSSIHILPYNLTKVTRSHSAKIFWPFLITENVGFAQFCWTRSNPWVLNFQHVLPLYVSFFCPQALLWKPGLEQFCHLIKIIAAFASVMCVFLFR